jgi:hypothetical protein
VAKAEVMREPSEQAPSQGVVTTRRVCSWRRSRPSRGTSCARVPGEWSLHGAGAESAYCPVYAGSGVTGDGIWAAGRDVIMLEAGMVVPEDVSAIVVAFLAVSVCRAELDTLSPSASRPKKTIFYTAFLLAGEGVLVDVLANSQQDSLICVAQNRVVERRVEFTIAEERSLRNVDCH